MVPQLQSQCYAHEDLLRVSFFLLSKERDGRYCIVMKMCRVKLSLQPAMGHHKWKRSKLSLWPVGRNDRTRRSSIVQRVLASGSARCTSEAKDSSAAAEGTTWSELAHKPILFGLRCKNACHPCPSMRSSCLLEAISHLHAPNARCASSSTITMQEAKMQLNYL